MDWGLDIVTGIKQDSKMGIVLPGGENGWKLELLTGNTSKAVDTNAVIERYDKRIATTVLADFVMLGQQSVGSFALASNKTKIFALAVGTYLDVICDVFNSQGIPRLMELNRNAFAGVTDYPRMVHGDIEDTGRRPNRLGLGAETFTALKNHPAILERVKYSGGTANPATVNEHVLEIVFGIDRVVRMSAVYNAAGYGQADDIQYICDSDAALLCYATDTPAIDAPSAGYTFTWDMLNNGQFMPVTQYPGESGTHTEFIEGLMAYDMHKTADDLAVFLKACV